MNSAFEKAEHEADRKKDKEKERPDPRTIGVVRSPSAERSGGLHGQTLPVLEEGKEGGDGSSNGGRSLRSYKSVGGGLNASSGGDGREGRPRTPAKDYAIDRSRLSAENAVGGSGGDERRPRTPVKDARWSNGSAGGFGRGASPNPQSKTDWSAAGRVPARDRSPTGRSINSIPRSSLDKDLPPLPTPAGVDKGKERALS